MGDNVVMSKPEAGALERVLIFGDLSKLTQEQRVEYYMRVCESVGLNPLTQPFDYLTLNGRLTLYAKKTCTDQLRTLHKISVVALEKDIDDGILTVTAKVQNAEGRSDADMGAVSIGSLKGDALANAIMKASTKAKRRATLSICGLGMLDESEIETIPAAVQSAPAPPAPDEKVVNPDTGRMINPNSSAQLKKNGAWDSFCDRVQGFVDSRDLEGLTRWFNSEEVQSKIGKWSRTWFAQAVEEFDKAQHQILLREAADA